MITFVGVETNRGYSLVITNSVTDSLKSLLERILNLVKGEVPFLDVGIKFDKDSINNPQNARLLANVLEQELKGLSQTSLTINSITRNDTNIIMVLSGTVKGKTLNNTELVLSI